MIVMIALQQLESLTEALNIANDSHSIHLLKRFSDQGLLVQAVTADTVRAILLLVARSPEITDALRDNILLNANTTSTKYFLDIQALTSPSMRMVRERFLALHEVKTWNEE